MEFPIYAEKGWRGRKALWIKNPDQHTDAYHVDFRGRNDMVVRRGGPQGPIVGRIEFHTWSSYIEIWFEDNTRVEMAKDGMFSSSYIVNLPASLPTSPFKWKHSLKTLELKDSKGQYLASFKQKSGWSDKEGIFNLAVTGISQPLMDQIFVTFMAYQERLRRARTAAAGAAGGAAGGGGGGGC